MTLSLRLLRRHRHLLAVALRAARAPGPQGLELLFHELRPAFFDNLANFLRAGTRRFHDADEGFGRRFRLRGGPRGYALDAGNDASHDALASGCFREVRGFVD